MLNAAVPGPSTGLGRRQWPSNLLHPFAHRCRVMICSCVTCIQHGGVRDPRRTLAAPKKVRKTHRKSHLLRRSNGHETTVDCFFRSLLETKPSVFRKKVRKFPFFNQNSLFLLKAHWFFIVIAPISSSTLLSAIR